MKEVLDVMKKDKPEISLKAIMELAKFTIKLLGKLFLSYAVAGPIIIIATLLCFTICWIFIHSLPNLLDFFLKGGSAY